MNDQAIKDIQKQNNKVSRILNKLCEKYPGLTQEIDLALYSCLKIEKIIKKHHQQHKGTATQKQNQKLSFNNINGESKITLNEEDQLFSSALTMIQGFKKATKKLQNKVGILLRQQELSKKVQRAKQNAMNTYFEALPYNSNSRQGTTKGKRKPTSTNGNTSPFSPHVIENTNSRRKYRQQSEGKRDKSSKQDHKKRVKDYMEESDSFEQMEQEYKSKNISELDLQIIELASEIKNLIKQP